MTSAEIHGPPVTGGGSDPPAIILIDPNRKIATDRGIKIVKRYMGERVDE